MCPVVLSHILRGLSLLQHQLQQDRTALDLLSLALYVAAHIENDAYIVPYLGELCQTIQKSVTDEPLRMRLLTQLAMVTLSVQTHPEYNRTNGGFTQDGDVAAAAPSGGREEETGLVDASTPPPRAEDSTASHSHEIVVRHPTVLGAFLDDPRLMSLLLDGGGGGVTARRVFTVRMIQAFISSAKALLEHVLGQVQVEVRRAAASGGGGGIGVVVGEDLLGVSSNLAATEGHSAVEGLPAASLNADLTCDIEYVLVSAVQVLSKFNR